MLVGYVHALLLVGANVHQLIDVNERTTTLQRAEVKGQPTTAELFRQHAAPSQSAVASPVTPPASGEPEVSSPASLPVDHVEILASGARGELQKMVKRLDKFPFWAWEGHSMRSTPFQILTARPQQPAYCMLPQPTATWRS